MADKITPAQRSNNMRAIRGKDTAPELLVRRLAHRAGFRFRLHQKDLPGKPDLVFPKWRALIFVHGCYWHGHGCKRGGGGSKSNVEYWGPKIEKTRSRDEANRQKLSVLGWRVLTLWECELTELSIVADRLRKFLTSNEAVKAHAPRPPRE